MADLSELLGDVYGGPDGPPVRHEPAADERVSSGPLDDDLATALSEALAAAPGVPAEDATNEHEPVAMPVPMAVSVPAEPVTAPAPEEPEPRRPQRSVARVRWETDYEPVNEGDDPFAGISPPSRAWCREDDDILPTKGRRRSGR
jgi:hypothetical protein